MRPSNCTGLLIKYELTTDMFSGLSLKLAVTTPGSKLGLSNPDIPK